MAFDPEHRLVLGVEFGKRGATRVKALLERVKAQLQGRVPRLVTTDEFAAYQTLLPRVWPDVHRPAPPPQRPQPEPDPALNYATACKAREGGRVTSVRAEVVFGTAASVAQALAASTASTAVNTSFLERQNGTDRHRNARKGRRTYRFSKDWEVHQAVGRLTLFTYNFCHVVRTLRQRRRETRDATTTTTTTTKKKKTPNTTPRGGGGRHPGQPRRACPAEPRYEKRTPAMAAGLTDHVWPLVEWLARPVKGSQLDGGTTRIAIRTEYE